MDVQATKAEAPLVWVDVLKGGLILLVTYCHALQFVSYGWGMKNGDLVFQDPLFQGAYLFHMPLFFVVAGYLRGRHRPGSGNLAGLLVRRVLRLGVPALVWYLVARGLFMSFMGFRFMPGSLELVLLEIFFLTWFIWSLLAYESLAILLRRLGCDRVWVFAAVWGLLLLCPESDMVRFIQYGFPFWVFGFVLGRGPGVPAILVELPPSWRRLPSFIAGLLGFLSVAAVWKPEWFIYCGSWSLPAQGVGLVALRCSLQICATVCAGVLLVRVCSLIPSASMLARWLAWFGRNSLGLYLAQQGLFIVLKHQLTARLPIGDSGVVPGLLELHLVAALSALFVVLSCSALLALACKWRPSALLFAGR